MLRVLLATPDFPPSTGGIAVLMGNLMRSMSGVEVRVVAFGEEGARESDLAAGFDTRRVGSVEMRRPLAVALLNGRLLSEIRRFRPDVILSGHVVASIAALPLQRLFGIPVVQYVHADEFRVRPRLTGRAVRSAAATIAVSRYTRDMALEAGADAAKVRVIPPGVELPSCPLAERGEEPVFVTVASFISPRKGHDVIVRALPLIRERVPGARWVTVGDGPLRSEIEQAAAAAGVADAVAFLGRVDDEERDRWLDRARAFCMPSRLPPDGTGGEGFGIVYLEAGAHGLPVVGGRVAGALDAVIDGETGLLVDPTDHEEVAEALVSLLSDRALADRLGAGGRENAEAHAWPRIGARVEALLEEIAAACHA
ncbi:MAG TPA: glycosyltransferase family 4 protein [Solirubrobacterales bacterium]|nr:glycosyltransferase family 4 protein [Solirubrobacterales bacterium]